jgi:selenocysteine insertion sequence-binding protein 2
MVSYAAAAKQSVSASSNSRTAPPAAPAPARVSAPAPAPASTQHGPLKVTALLTRNGPPSQNNGITNNSSNNKIVAPKISPSPSLPPAGGGPSPTTKEKHEANDSTTAEGNGGTTPKISAKQQKQPKKKIGSSQTQTATGGASNRKKSGPSPGPSKKFKPSPKEITLGDLIKKQQQPSQQNKKKQHKKPQTMSQHEQPFSARSPPPPPPRRADPVPLTMDNFPALSSSISAGLSTLPTADAGIQGKQKSGHAAGKIKHSAATTSNGSKASTAAPLSAATTPTDATAAAAPTLNTHPVDNTTKSKTKKSKTNGSPESKPPKASVAVGTTSSKSSSLGMAALLGPKASISNDMMLRGRDNAGGEHDLLRLMEKRQITSFPGRQRIRPRKKKFTALKKKVLEERFKKWRQLHPPSIDVNDKSTASAKDETAASRSSIDNNNNNNTSAWSTVCIRGFAEAELLEDDDEYEELVANLQEMAGKIGLCKRTFIPRGGADELKTINGISSPSCQPVFVNFANPIDAGAAVSCWHGLALGGSPIQAQHVVIKNDDATLSTEDWQQQCLAMASSRGDDETDPPKSTESETAKVMLENILTEDDMEDEDCLTESLDDCRTLAEQFGHVQEILVEREAMQLIVVYLGGLFVARQAAKALGQTVIAGVKVSATVMGDETVTVDQQSRTSCDDRVILLHGALTEDDLEDEECLAESLNDIRELALQFGPVDSIAAKGEAAVRIQFSVPDDNIVMTAVAGFNGMVIGGSAIRASLPEGLESVDETLVESTSIAPKLVVEDKQEPSPMFSGDKRIPERFAECKRVPKIPNASGGVPRHYAVLTGDDTVKPLLIEMMGELMRLQKRAVEENNTKAKRRLVMGLREVARGIRSHKTKMVVMANNLDDYGIIDDKLQQILDLCQVEGVPVFFEFNKRSLGKAIGKTIKVAVIG